MFLEVMVSIQALSDTSPIANAFLMASLDPWMSVYPWYSS